MEEIFEYSTIKHIKITQQETDIILEILKQGETVKISFLDTELNREVHLTISAQTMQKIIDKLEE